LLNGVHLWSDMHLPSLRKLNFVYMKVVRALLDRRLYGEGECSDREARQQLGWPALECLITRARLNHLASLLLTGPAALTSLLASTGKPSPHARLPWIGLVLADLSRLWRSDRRLSGMPDPYLDSVSWVRLASSFPVQFRTYVRSLFWLDSGCDPKAASAPHLARGMPVFSCEVCSLSFSNEKACLQHCRAKHRLRCYESQFVDDSGRCPVCHTVLHTRLRVLWHLCDPRRNLRCRAALRSGSVATQPPEQVLLWEEADRLARATARKAGCIHPQAVGTALRSTGKSAVGLRPSSGRHCPAPRRCSSAQPWIDRSL
jgi:hypothetical protein